MPLRTCEPTLQLQVTMLLLLVTFLVYKGNLEVAQTSSAIGTPYSQVVAGGYASVVLSTLLPRPFSEALDMMQTTSSFGCLKELFSSLEQIWYSALFQEWPSHTTTMSTSASSSF